MPDDPVGEQPGVVRRDTCLSDEVKAVGAVDRDAPDGDRRHGPDVYDVSLPLPYASAPCSKFGLTDGFPGKPEQRALFTADPDRPGSAAILAAEFRRQGGQRRLAAQACGKVPDIAG